MSSETEEFDSECAARLARVLCRATAEIMALRYADAIELGGHDLRVRMRRGAWATYHMPPQKRGSRTLDHHVIQFGTRCVESFFDRQELARHAQDDWEVRNYGTQAKYGPLTPAVALSFLVLHEFAHLLIFLDGHRKEGHGTKYKAKLEELHDANDGVLVAAFLRSEAEKIGIDLDAFIVPIDDRVPFVKGDRIYWHENATKRFGTVVRVNKKSLTIQPDGSAWKAYIVPSVVNKVLES